MSFFEASGLAAKSGASSYSNSSLTWFNGRYGNAVQQILASRLRESVPAKPFDAAPMRLLFDLDQASHCFDVDAHHWARFHEPQITGGLVHYLEDGGPDIELERGLALYRAACNCAAGSYRELRSSDIIDFEIVAEEPTAKIGEKRGRKRVERGKLDVLVHFELEDGSSCGAALEAKFDHSLSKGQLEKYSEHLVKERGWDLSASPLLLVSRYPITLDHIQNWQSATWWEFLVALEREITSADDDQFRQFRRTIWETAYG